MKKDYSIEPSHTMDIIVWETNNEVCVLCSKCEKLKICKKYIKGKGVMIEETICENCGKEEI